MAKTVYAVITIDGDLRIGDLGQQKAAINAMMDIHKKAGISGSTTWFINEIDFQWTKWHFASLLALFDRGEELAVHDHQDTHYLFEYAPLLKMMQTSKENLEMFFKQHRSGVSLRSHRNGCAFQNMIFYRVLLSLGYDIVSDVWPGMRWSGRMVKDRTRPMIWRSLSEEDPDSITMDNRNVPLGVCPWRHQADNWMDFHSQTGSFLHLPITTMPLIDRQRVRSAVASGPEVAIVVTDTHPYDLQDPVTGEVSSQACEAHLDSILWMMNEYNPRFVRAQQAAEISLKKTF